jgi:hypothetical protein
MAARRLIALLLALLVVSTVAAALTTPAPERETQPPESESKREPGSRVAGRLIEETLDASAKHPVRVEARRGDQVALTVRSAAPGQVEIPAFGLLEDVEPGAPARFNLLPERTGTFDVRFAGAGRVIGLIVVRAAGGEGRGSQRHPRRP